MELFYRVETGQLLHDACIDSVTVDDSFSRLETRKSENMLRGRGFYPILGLFQTLTE